MATVTATIPIAYSFLFDKHRYKVCYSGRGAGKSWAYARSIVILGAQSKKLILCTREIQKSIKDSVHKLLSDQIHALGLTGFYAILENEIRGRNGTLIIFAGLRHNVTNIKSLEGVDIAWVEEAEKVSNDSWDVLIPTIRKDGSEIWVSYNPNEDDDATHVRFATSTGVNGIVKKTSWRDNPYFPDVLRREMEDDKATDNDKYMHVWEGFTKKRSAACVYRINETVNCVDTIAVNDKLPIFASWDFGVADATAIILYQVVPVPKSETNRKGVIINVIDEHENTDQGDEYYRKWIDDRYYGRIDTHYCDPAGASRQSSLLSWVDKLALNPKTRQIDWHFEYTHAYSPAEMIDNANGFMPCLRISQTQTPKTWRMLKKWQYHTNDMGQVQLPTKPRHDEYSHLGTSLYYFFINMFPPREKNVSEIRVL